MTEPSIELLQQVRRHATDAPQRASYREIATGHALTYTQLAAEVDRFAATLRASLPAGATVVLRCPNTRNYPIAFLAALAAGLTVFPVPDGIVPRELDDLCTRAGARAIIDSNLSIRPAAACLFAESLPSLLLQSSGTTGLPKIVRRTAASLDAVCANMVAAIGVDASDQFLSCVPLCHSYGLEHGLLAPLWAGATVHLADGFDLGVVRRELAQSKITLFPAVPSIYEMLGNLPEPDGEKFPHLRVAYSAGGGLPESVYAKVLRHDGFRVAQLYGATEIGSVTFAHPASPNFDPASVGAAMNGVELRTDADGQLLVRATSMMCGYVGDDESPLTPDSFFPTGDLATLDARGNLFITGRLKLLIDVGGLKVNPVEVERAIADHPAVAACVVVPVRLSETVSRLKAIVTPADPVHPPAPEALRAFTRERLSSHKVPRVFEVRPTLPRSSTGKILRHLLVESA
jgi:acyl-CoA synthetase (AMP-forming)/AMP-acid ligase II